jgi:Putative rhamnosyl transferase
MNAIHGGTARLRGEFTHLLITRFNTVTDYAPSPKRLEGDWLRQRFDLFERYCLPSVKAQVGAAFTWLVLFDAASPTWVKGRVAGYGSILQPIYLSGPVTDDTIAKVVKSTGYISAKYLITTRLDNDDAIASDHVVSIQKAFNYQRRQFLAFPLGLQLYRGSLYHVYWRSNPFLSLIERVGEGLSVTTVCCVRHDRVAQLEQIRYLNRSPQWLQVLHTSNLGNALRGWPKLRAASHPGFAVQWEEGVAHDSLSRRIAASASSYRKRLRRASERIFA